MTSYSKVCGNDISATSTPVAAALVQAGAPGHMLTGVVPWLHIKDVQCFRALCGHRPTNAHTHRRHVWWPHALPHAPISSHTASDTPHKLEPHMVTPHRCCEAKPHGVALFTQQTSTNQTHTKMHGLRSSLLTYSGELVPASQQALGSWLWLW